jgi:hypothetical protein
MSRKAKNFGVTVSLYLDGTSGESSLDMYCEHNMDTAFRCPYAIGYMNPLPEGEMCQMKHDSQCPRYAAQLDALKRMKSMIAARIKKVEEELNNAD